MTQAYAADLTVIGVGNLLWADEGFGVRCVEHFHAAFALPSRTRVLDGGTLGGWLLDTFSTTRDLLIFDCADLKAAPGTLRVLHQADFALWSATEISPHQTGINDVLASAALLGHAPERITVIGVQPAVLDDYGGSLSDAVRAQVTPAVRAAADEIRRWGYEVRPRSPEEVVPPLTAAALSENRYEAERPSETLACRCGDPRFAEVA